jgi:hypothetical protein
MPERSGLGCAAALMTESMRETMSGPQGSPSKEATVGTQTAAPKSQIVRREDLTPMCPFCEAEVPEIYAQKLRGNFGIGRGFVFFCPHCRKVMGFGAQWYPFPG